MCGCIKKMHLFLPIIMQMSVCEELKQQLLQDTDFIQQIKKSVVVEEDAGKVIEEEQSDGLDMDEGMLMAGLSMFENGF